MATKKPTTTQPTATQTKASQLHSRPPVRTSHVKVSSLQDASLWTRWNKPVTGRKRAKATEDFAAAAVEMSRLSKRGDDYGWLQRKSMEFEKPYCEAFSAFLLLTGDPEPRDDSFESGEIYEAETQPIMEMFEITVEAAIEAARLGRGV
jgi:hypothetical protein